MKRILPIAAIAFALSLSACDRSGDAGAEPEHAEEEGHAEEEACPRKRSRLIPGPRASPATALKAPGHEAARAR